MGSRWRSELSTAREIGCRGLWSGMSKYHHPPKHIIQPANRRVAITQMHVDRRDILKRKVLSASLRNAGVLPEREQRHQQRKRTPLSMALTKHFSSPQRRPSKISRKPMHQRDLRPTAMSPHITPLHTTKSRLLSCCTDSVRVRNGPPSTPMRKLPTA